MASTESEAKQLASERKCVAVEYVYGGDVYRSKTAGGCVLG